MDPTSDQMVQLLSPAGERVEDDRYSSELDDSALRALYRDLVLVRRFDAEAIALQRQGEVGIWASVLGQEAAQVGAGRALEPQDWAFPTYREHGIAWCRGVPPERVLALFRGATNGGWNPAQYGLHLYTIVIGTQALHATGYAMGIQRDGAVGTGDPRRDTAALALFGDGATSEGDVSEAFNFAAVFNAPVVFLCQNNQWAISVPSERQNRLPLYRRAEGFGFPGVRVDGNDVLACHAVTKAALDRARSGEGPTLIEAYTYRMGAHTTSDDPTRYRSEAELEVWRGRDPITRLHLLLEREGLAGEAFFADLAAEADALGERLRAACRAMPDPAPSSMFDHVYSEPHRLVNEERAWSEAYRASFEPEPTTATAAPTTAAATATAAATSTAAATPHAVPLVVREPSRIEIPATLPQGEIPLAKAINEGLRRAMEDDDRVLLLGEDIGRLGGVFRVTDQLQKDFGEDRVLDTPLAESGIVGTAVGLALRGFRPVCEIQFDGFVYPAFDQIVTQLARLTHRSEGRLRMPVVIRIPFGGGIGAVEHHSESPEALFAHVPGLRVVSPSSPSEGYWMIQQAIACDDPVIFFEPKRRYWEKARVDGAQPLPLDVARVVWPAEQIAPDAPEASAGSGGDPRVVTVATYGPTVTVALAAAEVARSEGIGLEVIDLRSLSPLDVDTVVASVERTGRLVVVHEAPMFLGLGAELAARVTERCFYRLQAPVLRVGGFHTPYPPSRIEGDYLPDLDRILEAVDRSLAF